MRKFMNSLKLIHYDIKINDMIAHMELIMVTHWQNHCV